MAEEFLSSKTFRTTVPIVWTSPKRIPVYPLKGINRIFNQIYFFPTNFLARPVSAFFNQCGTSLAGIVSIMTNVLLSWEWYWLAEDASKEFKPSVIRFDFYNWSCKFHCFIVFTTVIFSTKLHNKNDTRIYTFSNYDVRKYLKWTYLRFFKMAIRIALRCFTFFPKTSIFVLIK